MITTAPRTKEDWQPHRVIATGSLLAWLRREEGGWLVMSTVESCPTWSWVHVASVQAMAAAEDRIRPGVGGASAMRRLAELTELGLQIRTDDDPAFRAQVAQLDAESNGATWDDCCTVALTLRLSVGEKNEAEAIAIDSDGWRQRFTPDPCHLRFIN